MQNQSIGEEFENDLIKYLLYKYAYHIIAIAMTRLIHVCYKNTKTLLQSVMMVRMVMTVSSTVVVTASTTLHVTNRPVTVTKGVIQGIPTAIAANVTD